MGVSVGVSVGVGVGGCVDGRVIYNMYMYMCMYLFHSSNKIHILVRLSHREHCLREREREGGI